MNKLNVGHIGWLEYDEGPECRTVAFCDSNEQKLAVLKQQYPDVAIYTDYRKMLSHPGLDAVVISTPNFVHAEQAIAFLEAGKHVMLEKPIILNPKLNSKFGRHVLVRTKKAVFLSRQIYCRAIMLKKAIILVMFSAM